MSRDEVKVVPCKVDAVAHEYGMLPWYESHIAYPRFCAICHVARGFEINYHRFTVARSYRHRAEHILNRLVGLTKNESTKDGITQKELNKRRKARFA
jgi:hypothetical protein